MTSYAKRHTSLFRQLTYETSFQNVWKRTVLSSIKIDFVVVLLLLLNIGALCQFLYRIIVKGYMFTIRNEDLDLSDYWCPNQCKKYTNHSERNNAITGQIVPLIFHENEEKGGEYGAYRGCTTTTTTTYHYYCHFYNHYYFYHYVNFPI